MGYRDFTPAELEDSEIDALKSFETELSSKTHQSIVLIAYTPKGNEHEHQTAADKN